MKQRFPGKSEIRKTYLSVRNSLSVLEMEQKSSEIITQLIEQSYFIDSKTVHIYASIEKNREVLTDYLITTSLKLGKRVVVPKMQNEGDLTHYEISSLDDLTKNRWGVPEPENTFQQVQPDELSLVVVPMVAGDFQKNRIGYGKGYYDRFLMQTNAYRTGLCYNCTLSWVPLPVDSHDQQMDQIITETKVI